MNSSQDPIRSATPSDEFPPDASVWPAQLDRRRFLQIMGGALGIAALPGCFRPPREEILPYVRRPEMLAGDGARLHFASTFSWRGYGRGIVVESHQGRPIKIEGNPAHPASLGSSDAVMQASLLDLYDPGRSKAPRREGQVAPWSALWDELRPRLQEHRSHRGKGLWLLVPPTHSPSLLSRLDAFRQRYPEARVVIHAPGGELHYLDPATDFGAADRILGIGADFLTDHPQSLAFARSFASRRRGWEDPAHLNRFYQLEAAPSVTGEMADRLLRVPAPRWPAVLQALLNRLSGGSEAGSTDGWETGERRWLDALVADLREHQPRIIIAPGTTAPAAAWRLARELGRTLGTPLADPLGAPGLDRANASLQEFADALAGGEVETALLAEANPAYQAPTLTDWPSALSQAGWTAHLAPSPDETAHHCRWHAPLHHFLEDWRDERSAAGLVSPVQPLIRPRFASRSLLAILEALRDPAAEQRPHDILRRFWAEHHRGDGFEAAWRRSLRDGLADAAFAFPTDEARRPIQNRADAGKTTPAPGPDPRRFHLEIRPDPALGGGEGARNAWLQELPKPISHQVWGSALWINPATADRLQLRRGRTVRVRAHGQSLVLPVLPLPGTAPGTLVAFLGHGRRSARLYPEQPVGANAFVFGGSPDPCWHLDGVTLEPLEGTEAVVTTQHHHAMDGHDFVHLRRPGEESPPPPEHPPTFLQTPLGESPQWAMSIDLSTCTGCGACITACQAENNTPVVGPEQVALGREMHWIRIDRYREEDAHGATRHHPQPVPCMHCEKAPCEVVCPVEATVHDAHGTNAMIYNRCIGTRYCSNNCPYKVRRFNFLDYRRPSEDPRQLQHNPEVTVRARGVMEKCTYCVQRTSRAVEQANAGPPGTPVPPVQTACAQACPSEAIVFGDLRDPDSELVRRKSAPGDYDLLGELDTRPRTTYLPRWLNPPI